jgi:hypothetical protein
MDRKRRVALTLGLFTVIMFAGVFALGWLGAGAVAHAAPPVRPAQQGVQATGMLTYGQGTCFPDAVLLDCSGNVARQLKGPGGTGFFAPYVGKWVTLDGAEMTCVVGDKYIQVVNIATGTSPCGTPTVTPGGPATATSVVPTTTPVPPPTAIPATAGNLALGKPVTASSAPDAAHPATHAVDGDPNTYWVSIPDPYTIYDMRHVQWIYVDLGASFEVRRMRMLWLDQYRPRTYAIYTWVDNARSWIRVAETRQGQVDDQPTFPYTIGGRYWLLWLEVPAMPGSAYALREWEIYADATTPIQAANLAAGKASVALGFEPGFEAAKASDADLATEWRSGPTIPTWLYTDLGTDNDIDRAVLRWSAGRHATSYTLYAWSAPANRWVAVYATNRGNGGDETVTFNPVRTRYVLLYAQAGIAGSIGLREIEVYPMRSGGMPRPDDSTGWQVQPDAVTRAAAEPATAGGNARGGALGALEIRDGVRVPDPLARAATE